MEGNIFSLIDEKRDSLSKTFKLIASFVRENYRMIPFLSIQELTGRIGVSTASITRFAQKVGFSGYIEFQKEIQKILQKEISPMREVKEFISSADRSDDLLQKTISLNLEILQSTYSEELYRSFLDAVELIRKSNKLYIIGLRSSYTVAYYLSFMLKQFMDNIVLFSLQNGDVFDDLSYVKKTDVLIAMSFTKYSRYTVKVVDYFQANGNKIIAVTDSYSSPIAIKADVSLIAKSSATSYSFVSAMTILNALIIALGTLDKDQVLRTMREKERIAVENDVYV